MLPAPNLDDRHFQQLVDDARRLVQHRCPEWTDHNISDPGITLIESFAMMVDQLIYRLNRVPDRHYVKFLELIGVERRPPGVAQGTVTFWLSAPQSHVVVVRAETEVGTDRTDVTEPVVFATVDQLDIVPCTATWVGVEFVDDDPIERTNEMRGSGFTCFSPTPRPGDCLMIGLSNAVPSCAVLLRIDCEVSGIGVDPRRPPLVWEAKTPSGWKQCPVDRDETGGLNKPGDVVLHLPGDHDESVLAGARKGWVRCRLIEPEPKQRTYSEPPRIRKVSASTIGGTASIVHARVIRDEPLGNSDGTAAQRFRLQHAPVLPWAGCSVVAISDNDESIWQHVDHFAEAADMDKVFHVDAGSGEVTFGPTVREPDGTLRQYGAIPPRSAALRMAAYRTGGGAEGNVATGRIRVLKTSVPYISRVENRSPAIGGAPAETLDDVKVRGPLILRSRGRAVTAQDFEELTREVAPEIARVHCLPATDPSDAGVVRVLLVPHVTSDELGRVELADLTPPTATVERIRRFLDERRVVGTRIVIEPPAYQAVTVVVGMDPLPGFVRTQVEFGILTAVYRVLHPLHGGVNGCGWPIGRPVQEGEIGAAISAVPGVDMSSEMMVRLYTADPVTRKRERVSVVPVAANALVYSYDHQVVKPA
ncbi:putative baseplate assembly protein [Rhodococcus opacus]|uniref:Baseplate J family protein n=1 Tax=Rhodococcus opacus TaxID=37919 RepID=A0A076EX27_RHOOP|nr:baseplate J family protein [Rhodococcus opacus]